MAIRTTSELVAGIIEVDVTIDLDPFIATSNSLVDEICVPAGYDDTRLELIERWLAAHFYAIRDARRTQEQAGSVAESFAIYVRLGLNQTPYGQQAMFLDTAGGLKRLNDGNLGSPSAFWLGTART